MDDFSTYMAFIDESQQKIQFKTIEYQYGIKKMKKPE